MNKWLMAASGALVVGLGAVLWYQSSAAPVPGPAQPDRPVTVLFVVEGPPETAAERARVEKFINAAVAKRHAKADQAGVILFGRQPRVLLPPTGAAKFQFKYPGAPAEGDRQPADISAALQLALASFPEGTGKRIVLISDGNENLGGAKEQAGLAKQDGVEIDTVLLGAGSRHEHEVLVERVEAPAPDKAGQPLEVRVIVRSYFSRPVLGWLRLTRTVIRLPAGDDGQVNVFETQPTQQILVRAHKGLTPFVATLAATTKKESYSYKAEFVPLAVEKEPVNLEALNPTNIANDPRLDVEAVKGDRPQNNEATTSVLVQGEKRVLLIEPTLGDHQVLIDTLRKGQGKPASQGLQIGNITPAQLPADADRLNFFLAGFDCIILANVPYHSFTREQDLALRLTVHDQGCGLIMIGGPNGFGAGGWQNSEVEKALPVTCELKSPKVEGRSGLVLLMNASAFPEGKLWQRKVAQLTVEKLSPFDLVGMLGDDGTPEPKWYVPLQTVGANRTKILPLVDTMSPGDLRDVEPALKKAYDALTDPTHELGTRHIIVLSDRDDWQPPLATLKKLKDANITVTTVCLPARGPGEYKRLKQLADATGGRAYPPQNANGSFLPLDPRQLPTIFLREIQLISKSYSYDKPFTPRLLFREGPTEGLPVALPDLYGFVRTTPRDGPLVKLPLLTPKLGDNPWPILAYWQHGLGKGVAFTSDAQAKKGEKGQPVVSWGKDWLTWDKSAAFWQQLVHGSLREPWNQNLRLHAEVRDGKVLVAVDARGDDKKPITDLEVVLHVTAPGAGGPPDRGMEQKDAGRYVAELPRAEAGSYLLTAATYRSKRVVGKDGIERVEREPVGLARAAVTVPHAVGFGDLEANPGLLKRLSEISGGKVYAPDEDALKAAAQQGQLFRPAPDSPLVAPAQRKGKFQVLLIDNSASMSATDVAPSRLEAARQAALKIVDALGADDSAAVVVVNSRATLVQAPTASKELLRAAIKDLPQTVRTTSIDDALRLAEALAHPGRTDVHLFSDGCFADPTTDAGNAVPIHFHVAGKPGPENVNNVGIVAFNVGPAETKKKVPNLKRLQAFVQVRNYCPTARTVKVALDLEVNGKPAQQFLKQMTLPQHNMTRVVFELPPLSAGDNNVLKVYLKDHADDFDKDDAAWVVVGPARKAKVMVVTPGNAALKAFFEQQAVVKVSKATYLAPADLGKDVYLNAARSGEFDLIIFDRCRPAKQEDLPAANTFFIDQPPPPWERGTRVLKHPVLIVSNREHPLLRDLTELSKVGVFEYFKFDVKDNLSKQARDTFLGGEGKPATRILPSPTRLLEAPGDLPLLFTLPRGGYTDLVMTFPLELDNGDFNTDWPLKTSFPLFLRNVLFLLGNINEQGSATGARPGEPLALRPEAGVQALLITPPQGPPHKLQRGGRSTFLFADTDQFGVYRVTRDDGGVYHFAINLLDAGESNIEPRLTVRLGGRTITAAPGKD
jgi:Mg-chelatase subunit ChlD